MSKWKKLYEKIPKACDFLEFLMAAAVFIGFLLSLWNYFVEQELFLHLLNGEVTFAFFLEAILSLVIGIEFLKMFCAPDSKNVIEVLIFMVARHMIIADVEPLELFLMVLAVCLLCLVRAYLQSKEKKE